MALWGFETKANESGEKEAELVHLSTTEWLLLSVDIHLSNGKINHIDFHGKPVDGAWQTASFLVSRLNNEEVTRPKDLFTSKNVVEKKPKVEQGKQSEEAKEEISNYYVKTDRVYLKSMVPVVERYRDMWNAVYIDPDSWFDKKLKEAYNGDSHQPEEEE